MFAYPQVIAGLVLAVCLVMPSHAVTQTIQLARTSILAQVVGLDGSVSVTGRAGEIGVAGNILSSRLMGQKIPNAASTVSMQPLILPLSGLGSVEIEGLAKPWFQARLSGLATQLVNHLTGTGQESAWFDYQQSVSSKGKKKYLVFSVSVKRNGDYTWSGVSVVDVAPTTVYITYTSKTVQQGLPSSWAYPNAGNLQYDVRNVNFQAVTTPIVLATMGAYDAPQASDASTVVDPDAGLKCLIDRDSAPGCNRSFPDARSLIKTTDSVRAMVDYVRMVKPAYSEEPDGSQVANMTLDIYERQIRIPSCSCDSPVYSNRQRYGYRLETTIDRYIVSPDGSYSMANRFLGASVSPTHDQLKSIPISRTQVPTLVDQILNPAEGQLNLLAVDSFAPGQIVNLAPITYR